SPLFDRRKGEAPGLTGLYRAGMGWDARPGHIRIDPVISFYFHVTPLTRPFTTEWVGKIYIPEAGTYVFGTEQLSTSTLFVDGKEAIDNVNINNLMEYRVEMQVGWH